jgi:hypothetical protein
MKVIVNIAGSEPVKFDKINNKVIIFRDAFITTGFGNQLSIKFDHYILGEFTENENSDVVVDLDTCKTFIRLQDAFNYGKEKGLLFYN